MRIGLAVFFLMASLWGLSFTSLNSTPMLLLATQTTVAVAWLIIELCEA